MRALIYANSIKSLPIVQMALEGLEKTNPGSVAYVVPFETWKGVVDKSKYDLRIYHGLRDRQDTVDSDVIRVARAVWKVDAVIAVDDNSRNCKPVIEMLDRMSSIRSVTILES